MSFVSGRRFQLVLCFGLVLGGLVIEEQAVEEADEDDAETSLSKYLEEVGNEHGPYSEYKVDMKALTRILAPFMDPAGGVSRRDIERAYRHRDVYGNKLHLPRPKQKFEHQVDLDHDGQLTWNEINLWPGWLSEEPCRRSWDKMYGCLPTCEGGVEVPDGWSDYNERFTKYHIEDKSYGSIKGSNETNERNTYEGHWSNAQKQVIEHTLKKLGNEGDYGNVVLIGLRTPNFWKDLFGIIQRTNGKGGGLGDFDGTIARSLDVYGEFDGAAGCDRWVDVDDCVTQGSIMTGDAEDMRQWVKDNMIDETELIIHTSLYLQMDLPTSMSLVLIEGHNYDQMKTILSKLNALVSSNTVIYIQNFMWEGMPGVEKAVREYVKLTEPITQLFLPGSYRNGVACYMAKLTFEGSPVFNKDGQYW